MDINVEARFTDRFSDGDLVKFVRVVRGRTFVIVGRLVDVSDHGFRITLTNYMAVDGIQLTSQRTAEQYGICTNYLPGATRGFYAAHYPDMQQKIVKL